LIDLHAHVIPGVGDGARSMDEAMGILRSAADAGVKAMVATPHILEFPSAEDWDGIRTAFDALANRAEKEGINMDLVLGAEVFITPDLPLRIKGVPGLTINGSRKYILLEMPSSGIPSFTDGTVFGLLLKGIVPIIAHPERNIAIQKEPQRLSELVGKGALTQINAESLAGRYGKRAQKTAKILLANNLAHMIASDVHALSRGPYPLLSGVRRASKIVGETRAMDMVTSIPERVIRGETIKVSAPKAAKRRRFKGLLG
jgi:protein-tyrosine phosphatase